MTSRRPGFVIGLVLGLLIGWSEACTPMLPRTGWQVSDADVARIQQQLGPDVKPEWIRDPRIDYTFEVTVPCSEMLAICWAGMPLWQKALGSVPLACTRFWFSVHREPPLLTITDHWKTAIAYSCPLTPEFAREHEREHLQGELHP